MQAGNINIEVALIVMMSGFLGMLMHWGVMKRKGRVQGTFFDYLISDNPTASGVTIGAFSTAMAGLGWAGTFDQLSMEAATEAFRNGYLYGPLVSSVVIAFTTGYFCDSTLNKDGGDASIK